MKILGGLPGSLELGSVVALGCRVESFVGKRMSPRMITAFSFVDFSHDQFSLFRRKAAQVRPCRRLAIQAPTDDKVVFL